MIAIYVDGSVAAGTDIFRKLTDKIPETFESKTKERSPLLFA